MLLRLNFVVGQIRRFVYDWKMWKTQLKLSGVESSPSVEEITTFYRALREKEKVDKKNK